MVISFEDCERTVEVHSSHVYRSARISSVSVIVENLFVIFDLDLKYIGLRHLNVQSPDVVALE
jgi:hypothetical protein